MAGQQFTPPPGYVSVDSQDQQPAQQTQQDQSTQPVQTAQPPMPGSTPKFAPPPGYVPVEQTAQKPQSAQTPEADSGYFSKAAKLISGAAETIFNPAASVANQISEHPEVVTGPGTLLDTAKKNLQESYSGVKDIAGGNVVQGATKILNQATGLPEIIGLTREAGDMAKHVGKAIELGTGVPVNAIAKYIVPNSFLDREMQKIDPQFRAAGEAFIRHEDQLNPLNKPPIDVANQIDPQQHPVLHALGQVAQSFLTPESIGIVVGTGGAGMVDSGQKLSVLNRLLSAGFTAQAAGDAYEHLKGFAEKYNAGDAAGALNELTYAVTSGAMAVVVGRHTAGAETPAVSPFDKAVAGKVGDAAKAVAGAPGKIVEGISNIPGKLAEIGAPAPTKEGLVGKIVQATGDDLAAAGRALPKVDASKVKTFEDLRSTLDAEVKKNTAQVDTTLDQKPELYKPGDLEKRVPVQGGTDMVTNPVQDAIDQLRDYYDKTKNTQESARLAGIQNKFESQGLTVSELNEVARAHSRDLNAFNASGQIPATSLARQAAENTRQGVKEQVRQIAPEIQDTDAHTSDLIKTRGLVEDMAEKVQSLQNKLQDAGYWRRGAAAASKIVDTLTGGFMKSLLKSGQEGAGAKNPVEIQDDLQKNIQKLNELNSLSPQAAATKLNLPNEVQEDALDIPSSRMMRGGTSEQVRRHEWGHALVAHKEGFTPEEIISHEHPNVIGNKNAAAMTRIDAPMIPVGKSGLSTADALNNHIDKILTTVMGGAAADEIHSGIPLSENPNTYGDMKFAKRLMEKAGYTPEQAQAKVQAAFERAKSHLSDQHAVDIINENADVREPGLPNTHHVSGERLKDVFQELDRRQNEGNNRRPTEGNGEHNQPNVSGREGGASQELGQKAAVEAPGGAGNGVKVPPEGTTGRADLDAAIKKGGAISGGLQVGDPDIGVPDLALFHDPKTGSTLAYPADKVTPEAVAAELSKSRKAYGLSFPSESDRISTRVPTAKGDVENHLEGKPLVVGLDAVNNSRGLPEKLASKVRNIPGVKIPDNIKDPAKVNERFIKHVSDNLKYLYDQSTPEEQTNNARWYESASKLAKDEADLHGIDHRQAAAAIAAMSPQKDWDMNVSLARRVMDIFHNHADEVATPQMIEKGHSIVKNTTKNGVVANEKLDGLIDKIQGKKLSDLTDPFEKAAWIRLYDEAHNPRDYHKIDPATGDKLDLARNANGNPSKVAWGSLNQVGNAISVLADGSRKNISDSLGGNHKVRNFFNNIIDPTNNEDVTIDTHAVAAGLLRPLSGNDPAVKDNFGGISNAKTGSHGSYPLYAEAYRRAAADLGIKPRELQSVTWEKIRNVFPAEWKTGANKLAVDKIWDSYDNGKVSIKQARQAIFDLAQKSEPAVPAGKPKGVVGRLLGKVPTGAKALSGE
jgi:hypothetical protein